MTKTMQRARYTLEFKQEAARLVEGGQSIAAAARSPGRRLAPGSGLATAKSLTHTNRSVYILHLCQLQQSITAHPLRVAMPASPCSMRR
jgi:hypothetical protein